MFLEDHLYMYVSSCFQWVIFVWNDMWIFFVKATSHFPTAQCMGDTEQILYMFLWQATSPWGPVNRTDDFLKFIFQKIYFKISIDI